MNGSRTTFMRKGHLLTALAAAVLLAASPGIAEAQSVSFVGSSGTVPEGSTATSTGVLAPLKVKVTRSAPPQGTDNLGTISIVTTPSSNNTGIVIGYPSGSSQTDLQFDIKNEATLTIHQPADDDWLPEKLVIRLNSSEANTSIGSAFTITAADDEVQPTASFSRTNIQLTENSSTKLKVMVGVPKGKTKPQAALNGLSGESNNIRIQVTPANAFAAAANGGVATLMIGTEAATHVTNMPGFYDVGAISAAASTTASEVPELTIMANDDMKGFQDPQITLAFVKKSLMKTTGDGAVGDIIAGPNAVINIQSDEEVPTLSFSPTDVTVDEGGSTETILIAEGKHGSEVGMVKLMVEGDAMVGLYQGTKKLEETDGHVMVDLGSSNSARLTAKSYSDPALMDGDTAYKAWKLVAGSTDGAKIGEGSWFRVDVTGSTAVPALPLVAQLLLALFLMAGGSRLYRRRQG